MIISGNVQTLMGPVPVKNIKAGDMVIGTNHVPCEVKAVKSKEVSKALVLHGIRRSGFPRGAVYRRSME